jgi:tripartite-type tricarboxylate transporter receptor subunit TctC
VSKRWLAKSFATALTCGVACIAFAQNAKPIKLLVGFPPGGGIDIVARALQPALQEILGTTVVVENKPGAGGVLAAQELARSAPDGNTLLIANLGPFALAPNMMAKKPYEPLKDFTYIAQTSAGAYVAAIPANLPANNLKEFVAWAKANAATASFASGGSGSITHMNGELLNAQAGLKMVHVPYKGSAPAVTDLIAGQTHLLVDAFSVLAPQIKAGKLKAIYVTGKERDPQFPNVMTARESGFAGLETAGWQGVAGPAGIAPDVVTKLNAAVRQALQREDVRTRLTATGSTIAPSSALEFSALVKADNDKWIPVIQASGVKME